MVPKAPPQSFLGRCVAAWRDYFTELGDLTSFVWLCIFPIAGSLLLAILFNGVAEGSELLAIQRTSAAGWHWVLTALAALYCIAAMACASGLAVRGAGKKAGAGDLIPFWILIVVVTAVVPIFFSWLAPKLSSLIPLGSLIVAYTVLFFLLPVGGSLWRGLIERVRTGLLPGNGLPIAAAILLGIGAVAMVAVVGNPVRFPTALATIAVVCIGVGFWSLASTVLLVVVPRHFQWPTLTIVAIAIVAIFERSNDERVIRVCQAWDSPCTAGVASPAPGDIHSPTDLNRTNVEKWMAHACPHARRACPMIFAAGEGGGLRAAYWTARVLSELNQSTQGAFYRHLFALSTVSGSSLGATAFVWLNQNDANPGTFDDCTKLNPGDVNPEGSKTCEDRLSTFVNRDYLSPSIAAVLFPEGLQRFWPVPIPQFDRARAFEGSLEAGWESAFGGDRTMSADFLRLYAGKNGPYMPALFLNSTNVELGKRFIISDLLPHFRNDSYYAYDANAAYHITKLPVSTAVHLTARFPYVSPAGVLQSRPSSKPNNGALPWGRLVDGGYFENTGVTTLADVVGSVKYALRKSNRRDDVRIYVLLILNNPQPSEAYKEGANISSLPDRPRDAPYAAGGAANQKSTPWSDYTAPIEGLFATQGARSFSDRYRLLQAAVRHTSPCPSAEPANAGVNGPQALLMYARTQSGVVSVPARCTGYWEISYARIAASPSPNPNASPNPSATPDALAAALSGTDYVKPALGWVLSDSSRTAMDAAAQKIDGTIPGRPVTVLQTVLKESDAP